LSGGKDGMFMVGPWWNLVSLRRWFNVYCDFFKDCNVLRCVAEVNVEEGLGSNTIQQGSLLFERST